MRFSSGSWFSSLCDGRTVIKNRILYMHPQTVLHSHLPLPYFQHITTRDFSTKHMGLQWRENVITTVRYLEFCQNLDFQK